MCDDVLRTSAAQTWVELPCSTRRPYVSWEEALGVRALSPTALGFRSVAPCRTRASRVVGQLGQPTGFEHDSREISDPVSGKVP